MSKFASEVYADKDYIFQEAMIAGADPKKTMCN